MPPRTLTALARVKMAHMVATAGDMAAMAHRAVVNSQFQ
jgi:hypothetical protein